MAQPAPQTRRSRTDLLLEVADDIRLLVRKELELARIELAESLKGILKGAGIVAAAALAIMPGVFFLVVAVALALPGSPAVGFAIVGGAMILFAGAGIMLGIRALKRAARPEKTIESVKESAKWARDQMKR